MKWAPSVDVVDFFVTMLQNQNHNIPPRRGDGRTGSKGQKQICGFYGKGKKGKKKFGGFFVPCSLLAGCAKIFGSLCRARSELEGPRFFLVLVLVTYRGRTLLGWEISPPTIGLAAFPLYQSTVLACTSVSFAPLAPRPRFRLFFPPPGTEHRTGWPT